MSRSDDRQTVECLAPGVIMALVDGQLGRREGQTALSHLQACARCRQLATELAGTAETVRMHLTCPDEETVAAYVDHAFQRTRTARASDEFRRVRQHLKQCSRCREQVRALQALCQTGAAEDPGRRSSSLGAGRSTQLWRLAEAASLAAVALVAVHLIVTPPIPPAQPVAPGHGRGASSSRAPVIPAPISGSRAPVTSGRGRSAGLPGRLGSTRPTAGPAFGSSRGGATGSGPVTNTALLPVETGVAVPLAQARAVLEQAAKHGTAQQQAEAALALGAVYHQAGRYRSAAGCYRRAAAAAERASKVETRVDALLLLGAVEAELGEVGQAQRQLESALKLARDTGYRKGEQNALVQLRLLAPEPEAAPAPAEGESP